MPSHAPKEKKERKSGKWISRKTYRVGDYLSRRFLKEAGQTQDYSQKRSVKENHSSHASRFWCSMKDTGVYTGVLDAPDYDSEDDISWKSSDDDQDNEKAQDAEDEDKYDVNETTQDKTCDIA
ncbi:hypothetical protein Tco_0364442 [Tanacetum coccineum]